MDKDTKRRLSTFYRELHWLRAILKPHERSIDYVFRENFAHKHLEVKVGLVTEKKERSYVSALLVDASHSPIRVAELTPHTRLSPLKWLLKCIGLIDPTEYWTLYGALRRLRGGEIQNSDSVVIEKGKWIVVLHEREVSHLFGAIAKCEVSVTILRVRSDESLLEHMALYDQSRWSKTQVLEYRT